MAKIEANVRFMSIEPLWFDASKVLNNWRNKHKALPFEWAIIGAASNGSKIYQPEKIWTQGLLDLFDELEIPVFFKGNMDWHEDDWRQEFPIKHVSFAENPPLPASTSTSNTASSSTRTPTGGNLHVKN
jgi:hypothetical protein